MKCLTPKKSQKYIVNFRVDGKLFSETLRWDKLKQLENLSGVEVMSSTKVEGRKKEIVEKTEESDF